MNKEKGNLIGKVEEVKIIQAIMVVTIFQYHSYLSFFILPHLRQCRRRTTSSVFIAHAT
jgi:hypothetical protein